MPPKVSDFLQGVRNCPPEIIPWQCGNCSVMDRRNDQYRDSLKPRCAEPNFRGNAVLKGVNDKGGFDHENIRIALNPSFAPPFYCVCGKSTVMVTFMQIDKWHFPQMKLSCTCGRSKTIIVNTKNTDLAGPWIGMHSRRDEFDLDPDVNARYGQALSCRCGRKRLRVYYERGGVAFFPREGETIVLYCSRCRQWKKIIIGTDIDASDPWLCAEMQERRVEIIVRISADMCPDVRKPGEGETVFVVPLVEK
ncbi:MAG: hypothetical protein UY31_C0022G0009 [Candidatus Wolfebacteria bacterium GW2011_GWE1_48_7]|uniref:Uncharacterized protein n=2 Tax=Candidatus Wolfeibacteriota TaxID=1752735 RepID=A0A0G1X5K5_9BACT|nr:MAG: hypothetical protein UX49_C0018G0032 [Candidatus Wolfebacteria bacterium GW2011_GWC2_46_275]KKU41887.1 MAG: hypothetical protein UX58_C0005G0037 [Candidatus Wolfebacteria bacterium GW2011_GWB2_46_69]KKU54164.1 MAG: hypothetical protein UX76_C0005G0037 [Candidatus Wolfebacteria bacterium GW2011_GWC1_47_103]KKU59087.1 MAG: hypothetical protein UX83_C0008G0037 [Candidatus Wolfebacteria bacterium GW2011_GWE2_47_12]KKU65661.1 MAG: hypothetical protein UX90_C0002G0037 [Candidatus Wolfebacteri